MYEKVTGRIAALLESLGRNKILNQAMAYEALVKHDSSTSPWAAQQLWHRVVRFVMSQGESFGLTAEGSSVKVIDLSKIDPKKVIPSFKEWEKTTKKRKDGAKSVKRRQGVARVVSDALDADVGTFGGLVKFAEQRTKLFNQPPIGPDQLAAELLLRKGDKKAIFLAGGIPEYKVAFVKLKDGNELRFQLVTWKKAIKADGRLYRFTEKDGWIPTQRGLRIPLENLMEVAKSWNDLVEQAKKLKLL